jgi:hypothetical protein
MALREDISGQRRVSKDERGRTWSQREQVGRQMKFWGHVDGEELPDET